MKESAFWTLSSHLRSRGYGNMIRRRNAQCGKQQQVLRQRNFRDMKSGGKHKFIFLMDRRGTLRIHQFPDG
ncbi:hypothetical protein DPMN_155405 [Dreissena polymorpha]|uniref:Uncharacterized protein n=1 Tax=Dreissena polymorpha TaxID=45954 RepID=A0A9D4FM66_DREPO|nr:hypothetical protein DPMN_155405 [Dreissena polymorpha]